MAFASGNTGKVVFTRDPDDPADGLDLALTHTNVVFWRFSERTSEYKSITPYPKYVADGDEEWHAVGRIMWDCFVRFLSRTSIADGDLSELPARFRVWNTTDGGLLTNYREGFGYATDIVTVGDRRGAVIVEANVKSARGRLTKVP